jgi:capsular polysaccharide biosynthesis protein
MNFRVPVMVKRAKSVLHKLNKTLQREPTLLFYSSKRVLHALSKTTIDKEQKTATKRTNILEQKQDIIVYENLCFYPLYVKEGIKHGGLVNTVTGDVVKEAIHLKYDFLWLHKPDTITEQKALSAIPYLDATFYYCGVCFNNFGHFVLESLSRLWAYEQYRNDNVYLIFHKHLGQPDFLNKRNFVYQVLKGFNIPLERVLFLDDVVLLKKVIIPEQKYGYGICMKPEPKFIDFIRTFTIKGSIPKEFENVDSVYVSRSQMPSNKGKPIGEKEFEEYLVANGYKILYPEKYTVYQQLAIYNKAKKIVFCDGGALHACILLPDIQADICVIARRRDHRRNCNRILEQFIGYKKDVLWIDFVKAQYQFGLETNYAVAIVDWLEVSKVLKDNNFVRNVFERFGEIDFEKIKRMEMKQFIASISNDKNFLKFMEEQKNVYPIIE